MKKWDKAHTVDAASLLWEMAGVVYVDPMNSRICN